jgi:Tol biopolymer transport system component
MTRQAILTADPISPRTLNPRFPAALERIILRALQKEPELRYQRASDLRIDLQRLQKRATRQRRQALAAAVVVVTGLLAGIAFWQSPYFLSQMASDANVSVRQLTRNADELGVGSGMISPDGQSVVFTDRTGIHLRTIETGETRTVPESDRLPHTARWDLALGWLADGTEFVANLDVGDDAADSTIMLAGTSGPPRKLRDRGQAISISPDGGWIAFATAGRRFRYSNIWLLSRDGKTERKLFDADPRGSILTLSWSPDGRRVAYVRADEEGVGETIEIRDLYGQASSTIFRAVEPDAVEGVAWLGDGRLLYSLRPGTSNDLPGGTRPCTHWEMRLDNTGRPVGSPTPFARWLPNCVGPLSVSADGQRASYLQWGLQDVIRLADLNQDGTRITASSQFTFTEGRNIPGGWTSDVKSLILVSDGSGRSALVRQDVDAETRQAIVEDGDILGAARLTPEGASVLYVAAPLKATRSRHRRLMQVPITGGPSREILTGAFVDGGARCAVLPATRCAIAELSAGGGHLVFTSIDVVAGRGPELARVDVSDNGDYRWALSPDGARIAVLDVNRPRIDVLSLTGMPPMNFAVKGHSRLGYVSWTADGSRLLVPGVDARGAALLSVDLGGNSHVLWQQAGARDLSGVPSPDGRRVAIWIRSRAGNLWLAETLEDAPRPID